MLSKELSNDLVLVDVAHAYNLDCLSVVCGNFLKLYDVSLQICAVK